MANTGSNINAPTNLHSEECSYWTGMCGSCAREFDEKGKLEIKALDKCIREEFGTHFGPDFQDCDSTIETIMNSLSKEEMDNLRNEWREKFYEKFSQNEAWADADVEFWNNSPDMMMGARVVFEVAQITKKPSPDVGVEASPDEIDEADEAIEKVFMEKLEAEGRLKKKVKRVPGPSKQVKKVKKVP